MKMQETQAWQDWLNRHVLVNNLEMTVAQRDRLQELCRNYRVDFKEENYTKQFDLPEGWVAGWVGPIYVGVSPQGDSHS